MKYSRPPRSGNRRACRVREIPAPRRVLRHRICMTMPNQVGRISGRERKADRRAETTTRASRRSQKEAGSSIPVFTCESWLEGVAFFGDLFLRSCEHDGNAPCCACCLLRFPLFLSPSLSLPLSLLTRLFFVLDSTLLFHGNVIYAPPLGDPEVRPSTLIRFPSKLARVARRDTRVFAPKRKREDLRFRGLP